MASVSKIGFGSGVYQAPSRNVLEGERFELRIDTAPKYHCDWDVIFFDVHMTPVDIGGRFSQITFRLEKPDKEVPNGVISLLFEMADKQVAKDLRAYLRDCGMVVKEEEQPMVFFFEKEPIERCFILLKASHSISQEDADLMIKVLSTPGWDEKMKLLNEY